MSNTGITLLGVIAAPLTLLGGPVLSFNALLTLALPVSALAMYACLRRWTTWRAAAFVGGLLYGFSPYIIGQDFGQGW